jgi:hypothetical protein
LNPYRVVRALPGTECGGPSAKLLACRSDRYVPLTDQHLPLIM